MFRKAIVMAVAAIISLSAFGCVSKNAFEMMEGEATRLEVELKDLQYRYNKLKDEKAEIVSRLEQELPYLPEKLKKNIIKELLSRPEGKLRDTWFKVFLYKNKKYAKKE